MVGFLSTNNFKRGIVLLRFFLERIISFPSFDMSEHISLRKEPVYAGWRSSPVPAASDWKLWGRNLRLHKIEHWGRGRGLKMVPWKSCRWIATEMLSSLLMKHLGWVLVFSSLLKSALCFLMGRPASRLGQLYTASMWVMIMKTIRSRILKHIHRI